MIKPKQFTNAWINVVSIVLFFISFFSAYYIVKIDLAVAFIRSMVVLVICQIITKLLVVVWHFSIPKEQWLIMTHGLPEVDSRSVRIIKQREAEETATTGVDMSGGAVEMDFD